MPRLLAVVALFVLAAAGADLAGGAMRRLP